MSSLLETIPHDILYHIASLSLSSSLLDSPLGLLPLMQTCSSLQQSLDVRTAPHVYAQAFPAKFDTSAASRRNQFSLTDSALAAEFMNRCRLLQRAKRADFTGGETLLQDLWTALWMLLESDGRNEIQLTSVNFPDFILKLARRYMAPGYSSCAHTSVWNDSFNNVVIWLLCLSLSRSELSLYLDPPAGRFH